LSRLATSFVLGYHGCEQSVVDNVINGKAKLKISDNDFDRLGSGTYFWEADPQRAMEYARWKNKRGEIKKPAVVGAVIDLRNCLDLTNRADLETVKQYHEFYVSEQERGGLPLPENQNSKDDTFGDLLLRYLDCAVINYLTAVTDQTPNLENYDTIRGLFTEGGELYQGAGFKAKAHTQIAVRNPDCVIGYFKPRNLDII
jgi:hypothetical protein